jgi:hypothetical protein
MSANNVCLEYDKMVPPGKQGDVNMRSARLRVVREDGAARDALPRSDAERQGSVPRE